LPIANFSNAEIYFRPVNKGAESRSEARLQDFHRKHHVAMVTMVFTDIVGSTLLKTELGDLRAVEIIERHHEIVRTLLLRYPDAEEISTAGDSFFLVFVRPSEAVHFALKLQNDVRQFSAAVGVKLANRIGIHVGEVFVQERADRSSQLFGIQIDTCARIMDLGHSDQILLSRFAYDSARHALRQAGAIDGLGELTWMSHGSYDFKGLDDPMEVCEVGETGLALLTAPGNGVTSKGAETKTISFQAKDGRSFRNVKVTVTDKGLNVVNSTGGALVPFNQLPDDRSVFPEKLREEISNTTKVNFFKLSKPPQPVVVRPRTTRFEGALLQNYSRQTIETRRPRNLDEDTFIPSFLDGFPANLLPSQDEATRTLLFINHKIRKGERIIYYDSKIGTFICGCPAFCPQGRIRILYADCRSFNPADLDPNQIEKISHDDGTLSLGISTTNRTNTITHRELDGSTIETHSLVLPVADNADAHALYKAIVQFISLIEPSG
jgi:class 3 adenylate cyclase